MKTPLTPLEPVLRALQLYGDRVALRAGDAAQRYTGLADRTARLITLLRRTGLPPGGHVLLVSPNTPDALLAFHAVPLAGGVIVPLNPAFTDEALQFLAGHADPRVALVDAACLARVGETLERLGVPVITLGGDGAFEQRLARTPPARLELPAALDEDAPISVNYTSGTTSDPKGVMVTHRNAYINLSNLLYHLNLRPGSVYLHALPLAHGNGWGSAWAVTAAGGTHVMLPAAGTAHVRQALMTRGITHLFASPAILTPLADPAAPLTLPRPVRLLVAGTTPPPRLLSSLRAQGFEVLHGYGLTETNAVLTISESDPDTPGDARALARQGHPMVFGGQVRVVSEGGEPVPHDGFTPGEIVIRSNQVMKGYYKNRAATRRALEGGWLHTGDLAVVHADGRVDILDRAGDLLNLGGQAVSSAQIEAALYRHPSVHEAVVVAGRGGEEEWAVAFVTLHPGAGVGADELLRFCAPHLPGYALPRRIQVVQDLPKTASGKVLKHVLRSRARERAAPPGTAEKIPG